MTATTAALAGLTESEVTLLRTDGKGNTLPPPTNRTYWQIARDNIFTFINIAIFVLGATLVLVGRPMDALLSVGIIGINIMVSLVQEVRAKRILDQVALLTRPLATVMRDGQAKTLAPDALVLGDVLKVGPGDQVLLDGAVLDGTLAVDESQLTGESDHVQKAVGDALYSGSFCVTGSAYYVAQKVGADSFANQLTQNARSYRRVVTPLQRQIGLAVNLILFMVIYLQILLVANNLLNAVPLPDGVEHATVLVSLVPNGLFLSIAVAYAVAAVRIVRVGALLQQSNAVESLSNVDVLCLDKTGTLTTNHLQVDRVLPVATAAAEVENILGVMMASTRTPNKTSEAIGEAFPAASQPMRVEVPFSSARKWSAIAFEDKLRGIYVLGAPEMLRPFLAPAAGNDETSWDAVAEVAGRLTNEGLRVLLLARHPDPALLSTDGDAPQLPVGCVPLAIVSISDELRPEAKAVLEDFIASGVNPKIISGDNPETVAALARQAGLAEDLKLVSGPELAGMSGAEFDQAAVDTSIFGRITPQQKERLVDALRRRGHYVAMIGDGVNDVLSMKKANLAIAMQSGSQATRSVADIILLNDSFAALGPAVAEGQRIVNGMQDILKLFLARIATMMLLIVSAWTIGIFPIAVRQGTIVTLLTVGIPTVLLAIWARPGYRHPQALVNQLVHFVVPPALLASLLGLVVFYVPFAVQLTREARALGAEEFVAQYALTIRTNQTALSTFLIGTGLLLLVFVEPPNEWWVGGDSLSGDQRPAMLAALLGVVIAVILATPGLRDFFDLTPLLPLHWALISVSLVVWLVVVRLVWRHRLLERYFGAM